ncbi:Afadin and alpha-actinin-binding-domain-containing protein [Schizothecium vesticola]|uniref:Afadin and alpha-actinin-binding-domain-containing protein n=1 Tax=Schizothecium vesticola TaxID=314040 RepID=A0AA40K0K4_9PEZI|nr:Afadin and alpha-actinin-binding-domain-containing protein [Schizothecium vesticola]
MVELDNLRQASLYINNQLLSRGLLRDGQTIDFTDPGETSGEVAATMGRVIAVVNDLILRRDRDAEHRESLSTTLRTLRAESLRQTNDIQRLQEKNTEAQRKVGLSEAAEASMRTQLKAAESTIQRLKEEAARTKILVAQTRAACANEVRKRDRQIDGLKKAVTEAGRARGASKSPGITTITVVGDIGSEGEVTSNGGATGEGYDLRAETNSFLAELAKSLSEENESIMLLIRKTKEQLEEMSGWDSGVDTTASQDALALPASCAEMSAEIESILQHLRTILTNPSFVPIEEVVVREHEIHRLRDGWEKMETRWQEAVHLIDGWRRRMQVNGRPVNVEELKMGLRLSPVRVRNVAETTHGLDLRLSAVSEDAREYAAMQSPCPGAVRMIPTPELDDAELSDSESSIFEDDVDVDDLDVEEPNVEILHQSFMLPSSPLPVPPHISPLRDSNTAANRGGQGPANGRKRLGEFTPIAEENAWELKAEAPLPPPHAEKPQQSPIKKTTQPPPRPVQEPEDAPLPTMSDLSASASSATSVQLVKTPTEAAPRSAPTSARGRGGRISPTGRASPVMRTQDRAAASKPLVNKPSRAPLAREKSRARAENKPENPSARPTRNFSNTRHPVKPSAPSAPKSAEPAQKSTEPAPKRTEPGPQSTESAPKSTEPAPPPPSQNPAPKISEPLLPPPITVSNPTPSRNRSPARVGVNSRLPLPRTGANILPPPQQSPLSMATITAKLVASERDADAARVRAKLKAARAGVRQKRVSLAPPVAVAEVDADAARSTRSEGATVDADADELAPAEEERKPVVKKRERRTSRVASRRRSTLNPWELETLIKGAGEEVVEGEGA